MLQKAEQAIRLHIRVIISAVFLTKIERAIAQSDNWKRSRKNWEFAKSI